MILLNEVGGEGVECSGFSLNSCRDACSRGCSCPSIPNTGISPVQEGVGTIKHHSEIPGVGTDHKILQAYFRFGGAEPEFKCK